MNTLSFRLQAINDLLRRYAEIFRDSWSRRREMDSPARLPHELAFLPSHLELMETPVHPAPLWTARVLCAIVTTVILLSLVGRLDIVAVAPGKIVPSDNVKTIQPAITGVVRHIYVHNGERVSKGQLLVDLDCTQAAADADRATTGKLDAQLTIARVNAVLLAQKKHTTPVVAAVPGVSPERMEQAQVFAREAYREYASKLESLESELTKRQAELQTTREEVSKLEQTAPLARQQADDYQNLVRDKYVATHEYLDKKQAAIEQEQELAAQRSHAQELQAGIVEQQRDIESTTASFRREQADALDKAEEEAKQDQDDETKAVVRQGLMQLTAPVGGIVQQLDVHTVGGVVTTAQALMEIVPDEILEIEADVSNKDIGFVNPGQTAIVKVTTFPYTRYGYITGTVVKVANDATQDKKLGPVFVARIRIPSSRFRVAEKVVDLTPGMDVTAEIKTGKQRVWQYFLSPLIETGQESLRER